MYAAGRKNERSIVGIMQWMKLSKYLTNPSADVISLTKYLNVQAIR